MVDRTTPSRGGQRAVPGKMHHAGGAAVECNRGSALDEFLEGNSFWLRQFHDAVKVLLGCEATETKKASPAHGHAERTGAQGHCKSVFLRLLGSTANECAMINAANRFMMKTPPDLKAKNSKLLHEKYRRDARCRVKDQFSKMVEGKDKTSKMDFSMCHQQTSSELFSVTVDARLVAVDLQVCVWQLVDLARHVKISCGWRAKREEGAAEAAPVSPPAAKEGTREDTSLELIVADVQKVVPKEKEGDNSEGNGPCHGAQERASSFSPPPPGDEEPFKNGPHVWSEEVSDNSRFDAPTSEADGARAIGVRSSSGGSSADGDLSRQTHGKRHRVGSATSLSSRERSIKFRPSCSGPRQIPALAMSSLADPRLSLSRLNKPSRDGPVGTTGTAAAATTGASPHSTKPPHQHRPSDRASSMITMSTKTRRPTLDLPSYCPPKLPKAHKNKNRTSVADNSSAGRGRWVQSDPERAIPRSMGPPPAAVKGRPTAVQAASSAVQAGPSAVQAGSGEGRWASNILANAEKISALFENLGDDERVEAKIAVSWEMFERAVKRLESNTSWSVAQHCWESRNVRIYSNPGEPGAFVHASIFDPVFDFRGGSSNAVQYYRRRFDASCPDGSSVIFRRVREWEVDGPAYFSEKKWKWVQCTEVKRFFHETKTSSFLFRLVKMREGETWNKLCRTQPKFFVYVQTHTAAKARQNPIYSGCSLVNKVLDMLYGSGKCKALVIREKPASARSGN